jgi:hypothetical protein
MKWWKLALAMAAMGAAGMAIASRGDITRLRRTGRS